MTSNRPYRVGMARDAQRYIEPDEIYEDMRRGASARIPRMFPYSWNPVNGLGADATAQSIVDDVIKAGQGIVSDTTSSAKDRAQQAVLDSLNNTPAGKAFLDAVQSKAAEGVTDVVKEQAPNLMMLAVAGGAVGGALSAKLGKTGTVLAIVVAGFAALQLLNAGAPKTGAKK